MPGGRRLPLGNRFLLRGLWRCCVLLFLLTAAGVSFAKARRPPLGVVKVNPTVGMVVKAVAARQAGELQTARQLLTAAYRLRPSTELLRELGLLARAEQRPIEAQDLFRRYLTEVEGNPTAASSRAEVESLLEPSLPPTGRLRVLGEPGALVSLDGRLRGTLPLSAPLLVSTEEHQLIVEQRSGPAEAQIQVSAFRMSEVRVSQAGSRTLLVELLPAVLLLTASADAKEPSTETAEKLRALETGLAAALEGVHLTALSVPAALEFTSAKRLASCLGQTVCQTELAKLCAIDYVLRLRVPKLAPATLPGSVGLELIDVSVGDVAAANSPTCEGCDPQRLSTQLAEGTQTLISQAQARPRGQLEIASEPSGAEVALNGHVVGHTPYRSAYFVGAHTLNIRHKDAEPDQRRLVVTEGQLTNVRVALTLFPVKPLRRVVRVEGGKRPRWRLITGGLATFAGVLMLGFGGRAVAISGTCSVPPPTPEAECQFMYETTALGAGLLGVGGALGIAGAVLIGLPGEKRRIEELVP